MCASGKLHGFRAGQYYASHRSVGGQKTFWKVDFHTLEAIFVSAVDAEGSPVTSDMEVVQRDGQVNLEVELVFGKQKKAEAFEWLDRYCTRHPDEFFVIGGHGHREVTELTKPYRTHEAIFWRATHIGCARVSFSNALYCVVGEGPSLDMLHNGPLGVRRLVEMQIWSEKNLGRYGLRKCDISIFESHTK